MSFIIWGIVSFLFGLVGFIAAPLLVAPQLDIQTRHRVARVYWKQSMSMFRQCHLVELSPNNHTLIATDPKPTWPADEGTLGDSRVHWQDNLNRKVRLFGRPFGASPSGLNAVVHPRDAELGELHEEHVETGDHKVTLETADGEPVDAWNKHLDVPDNERLVSLQGIRGLLGKSSSPDSAETSYDYVEKSQRGFDSRDLVSVMTFLIAFGGVYGGMWFVLTQLGGGGGGGGVSVSEFGLFLGALL